MKVDTDRNEKERRIKYTVAFLMVEDETTNPEKTEALYESVRSWGMEEEDNINFTDWKGVDEYRDTVDPTSLLYNSAVMFTEVASLINYHV